jgi:ferrous iron transport protein A
MKSDATTRDCVGADAPLPCLRRGEVARIVRVDAEPAARRKLLAVGIRPGAEVEVLRRAPGGDPLEIVCGSVHLMIRAQQARGVWVRR